MSGFAGWLAFGEAIGRYSDRTISSAFSQALDAPGIGAAKSWSGDGIVLTHRQRITAPQDIGDRQPRQGNDSPFVLLFDGYLINRDELAEGLSLPLEAQGWPDSAFVMAALERWGEKAPSRLLGDFALALWDDRERCLLLARDGIGQRPLYYHQGHDFIAFATTPRALLALPQVPRAVDENRFARLLLDLPGEVGSSYYASIRSLPAGHQAKTSGGQIEVRCYWSPDYEQRLSFRRDEDYVERGRELLDRAVRACLRIEGTPVSAITGGLDSSGVAVTALKSLPTGRLDTVTAVHSVPTADLTGKYADETPLVEAIARQHPGLAPAFVSGSGLHRWDERWNDLFLLTGIPWRNVMNLAWLGPARDHARSLGANVLLSGGGGNITLSWSGLEGLPASFRNGEWAYVGREVRALSRSSGLSSARQFWRSVLSPMMPPGLRGRLDRLRGRETPNHWLRFSAVQPDFARRLGLEEEARRFWRPPTSSADIRRRFFPMQQAAFEVVGLGRALHGLETRDPTLDRRLLEFCFAVPDTQYLQRGVTRSLARRILADRLPPEVVNNRLRGLQGGDYFHRMSLQRAAIVEGVEALERSAVANRLLDVPRLKELLDRWPADHAAAGPEYMAILHRGLHFGQFLRWIEGGNS
ncbi:asparagine synthase-related protein [Lacibacterium aquatile]|uniref:asparagine synthase (glutamine-hydrolyzing) n=1 Tax=Lacibacterium aquatile TaxID=1168082 RepID=A0ABW5DY23_9PROT